MELHEKISKVREVKKISRAAMATALNMSTQSYWNVETGKTELTVSRLNQIAGALGVSVMELMSGELHKIDDAGRERELEKRVGELEEMLTILKDERERLSDYFLTVFKDWLEPKILDLLLIDTLMGEQSLTQAEKIIESVLLIDDITKEVVADFVPKIAHIYCWLVSDKTNNRKDKSRLYELITQKGVRTSQAILDFYFTEEQQEEFERVSDEDFTRAMRAKLHSLDKNDSGEYVVTRRQVEDLNDKLRGDLEMKNNWDLRFYRLLKAGISKFPLDAESAFEAKQLLFNNNKIVFRIKLRPDGWREAYVWIAETIHLSLKQEDLLIKKIVLSGVIKDKELSSVFK